jgi:hypothetical protein
VQYLPPEHDAIKVFLCEHLQNQELFGSIYISKVVLGKFRILFCNQTGKNSKSIQIHECLDAEKRLAKEKAETSTGPFEETSASKVLYQHAEEKKYFQCCGSASLLCGSGSDLATLMSFFLNSIHIIIKGTPRQH